MMKLSGNYAIKHSGAGEVTVSGLGLPAPQIC